MKRKQEKLFCVTWQIGRNSYHGYVKAVSMESALRIARHRLSDDPFSRDVLVIGAFESGRTPSDLTPEMLTLNFPNPAQGGSHEDHA